MPLWTQGKLILARYGRVVALGLVLIGIIAVAGAATTYLNPQTYTVTEQTHQQTFQTETSVTAIVQRSTLLYEEGQRLKNEPVYFYRATPNITLHIHTQVPADQSVALSQRLVYVVEAVRNQQPFYSSTRLIASKNRTVTSGSLWMNTTLNATNLRSYLNRRQAAVGTVGSVQNSLRLIVQYESNRYSGTLSPTTSLEFGQQAYWLTGSLAASTTKSKPVTITKTRAPNMTTVGTLIGIGLLVFVLSILAWRWSQTLDPTEIETDLARSRYDEWISNGEVPTKSGKDFTKVESLEDLVDVAIDTNQRVIYDRDIDAYAVIHGDIVFYHTTQESDFTEWFDV